MAASILLLHRIAIFFGCPIKYKPLILCAVMAFLVNFATLNISPFLTRMHYALILIFVLAASLGVTLYNAHLLKKDRLTASASIRGEPPADEKPAKAEEAEPSADEKPAEAEEAEPSADEKPAEAKEAEPPADEKPAEAEAAEPVADEKPAEAKEAEPPADEEEEEDLELEPAVLPSEEERQRAKEELKELTEAVGRLHSMDDYLNYADKESRSHRLRRAVFAYKQALGIYWNDDYAPFIAINLGNTYKEMGEYEAASDTYETALALPATQESPAMQQELRRSINYLRTVRHILASHGIANMPLAQIPPEVSAEIESVIQEA